MTPEELESFLYEHIPLMAAMQLGVTQADSDGVHLVAPLAPNMNHQGTAFGGSIAALAIATGWCAMRLCLGPNAQVVIQKGEVEYLHPIQGPLEASCELPSEKDIQKLRDRLSKRGRARTTFDFRLESEGKLCALLVGKYVGIVSEGRSNG